jgi:hypothetical protein
LCGDLVSNMADRLFGAGWGLAVGMEDADFGHDGKIFGCAD